MNSRTIIDSISVFLPIGAAVLSATLIILFNARTILLARKITAMCRIQNMDWSFFTVESYFNFVFSPEKLLKHEDPSQITEQKKLLIEHRKSMWKTIYLSCAVLFAGFFLIIGNQFFGSR